MNAYKHVEECSGLVRFSKCSLLEKLRKAKFTHLTILKHQNTKTYLYKLSKNHWVIALLEIFGSVRKKLQFTVFNDHPVDILQNPLKICRLKDKVCTREMMNQNLQQKNYLRITWLLHCLITIGATIDLCAHCEDHQRDRVWEKALF